MAKGDKIKKFIMAPASLWPGNPRNAAGVDRKTAIVYLNKEVFPALPKIWREWIIKHEEGHLYLDTENEFEADSYAFFKCADKGYSLRQLVLALCYSLTFPANNPEKYNEHLERLNAQYQRAIWYDKYVNGNTKIQF